MAVEPCPLCSQSAKTISYGVVAPWIGNLINDEKVTQTKLMYCQACNFKFFSYRYSSAEMLKIYSGYRGESYFRQRHKYEPWYTRHINDFFKVEKNILQRKERIYRNLEDNNVSIDSLKTILDYGGDEGQFFPDHLDKTSKFLLDVSSVGTNDEFTRITSVKDLPKKIDLVMCCMVLEHVENPLNLLSELKSSLNVKGATIYVEVPNDTFTVSRFHSTAFYKSYVNFLYKHYFLFVILDFLSGFYRNYTKRIPFFGIVKQSEHINYFSKMSLGQAFLQIGINVEVKEVKTSSVGGLNLGSICAIARVNK